MHYHILDGQARQYIGEGEVYADKVAAHAALTDQWYAFADADDYYPEWFDEDGDDKPQSFEAKGGRMFSIEACDDASCTPLAPSPCKHCGKADKMLVFADDEVLLEDIFVCRDCHGITRTFSIESDTADPSEAEEEKWDNFLNPGNTV